MFRLNCLIEFTGPQARVRFDYVTEVSIETSVNNLTDTAVITLPRKLGWKGKPVSNYIKRGDKVSIQLGYDGKLESVFKGYVKNIQKGTPLRIECEDEMYRFKQIKLQDAVYTSTMLQAFLKTFIPADIRTEAADLNLGEVRVANEPTAAQVLEFLRSTYGLSVYFQDNDLYAVLPSFFQARKSSFKPIIFSTHVNVISDSLVFTSAEDLNIAIVAKAVLKDNTALEWREPQKPSGKEEIRTFYCHWAKDVNDLKAFAAEKLEGYKVDTMTGSFMAFGIPFVRKGDLVKFIDPDNSDRSGMTFSVAGVRYEYGTRGYKQTINLGGKV